MKPEDFTTTATSKRRIETGFETAADTCSALSIFRDLSNTAGRNSQQKVAARPGRETTSLSFFADLLQ